MEGGGGGRGPGVRNYPSNARGCEMILNTLRDMVLAITFKHVTQSAQLLGCGVVPNFELHVCHLYSHFFPGFSKRLGMRGLMIHEAESVWSSTTNQKKKRRTWQHKM